MCKEAMMPDAPLNNSNFMKKIIHTNLLQAIVFLLLSGGVGWGGAHGQGVFSRFDFTFFPLTTATIGPDANSINPNSVTNAVGLFMSGGCNATFGFDLDIPNQNGIFDVPSIGMRFGFKRLENRADFFVRGGTRFYVTGGALFVQYEIENATGIGTTTIGPLATGYLLPTDNQYHEYTFEYTHTDGVASVFVDGAQVWTFNGPNNSELAWDSNVNPVVGTVMDGNCLERAILDYAEFYVPQTNLPVEWLSFEVEEKNGAALLTWTTANEVNNDRFRVERALDGEAFVVVGEVAANAAGSNGLHHYEYAERPGAVGFYRYRLMQIDADGRQSVSEERELWLSDVSFEKTTVYPNPFSTMITIEPGKGSERLDLVDAQGNVVRSVELASDEMPTQMNTDDLPSGLYTLVAKGPKTKEAVRLIKK